MDTKKIMAGVIVWSVGLLIPIGYHMLLIRASLQEKGYLHSFHIMAKNFFDLPWVVWPYMVAMAMVGGALVKSGIRGD